MKFPVELTMTQHKFGGRIVRITGIAHSVEKPKDRRSQDRWWFIGDVEWRDGGKSAATEIAPYQVCGSEEARIEINPLMEAMNDYLSEHGEWCEKGNHEGWYAHRKVVA